MIDLAAARTFQHSHARLIDRRRFAHAFDDASAELVFAALQAYRNPDGGIGALEPDVRTPTSQPSALRYAMDILAELPPSEAGRALALGGLDWLQTVTCEDGGVPFILPSAADQPTAPWFAPQLDPPSSLLMTAQLAAAGHRLELDHPWLAPATDYCWSQVGDLDPSEAYTFRFFVDFLDAVPDRARAEAALAALADRVPDDGRIVVSQGVEGELLDPLDIAPWPQHAGAGLFSPAVLESAVDELEARQQADGGWDFSWGRWNPAAAWEWRGAVTMTALHTLRAYDRTAGTSRGQTL